MHVAMLFTLCQAQLKSREVVALEASCWQCSRLAVGSDTYKLQLWPWHQSRLIEHNIDADSQVQKCTLRQGHHLLPPSSAHL